MRRNIILLFSIVSMIFVSACEGTQANRKPSEKIDLEAFLQTAELPKNLSISFDPTKVLFVDSARIYTADLLELNPDIVAEKLLRREIVERLSYAEGPAFQTGDESFKEYLTVFDGGKSFGSGDGGNGGGMHYSAYVNGVVRRPAVIANYAGPPDMTEQLQRSLRRSDYASSKDLSFMNYTDALKAVQKQLYAIGIPELGLAETYSLDLDTIREHYVFYLEENRDSDEIQEYTWSKDDERYLFHFRQLINNIPVVNVSWHWGKGTSADASGGIMRETHVNAAYTKDGVTNISAINLFDIPNGIAGEDTSLVGAAEALQVLISEYADLILEEGTTVVSAELVYVSIPDEKKYKLIPAWIFGIEKPNVLIDNDSGVKTPYNEYSQYVVDASTGTKLSGVR